MDNTDDMIDSRDVIERIAELEVLEQEYLEAEDPSSTEYGREEDAELSALRALAEEAEGYAADWRYGEQLIRDSYFTEYAQQLADDICPSPETREMSETWPYRCIDWEQAARELQMDYTAVEFDGVTYWIR